MGVLGGSYPSAFALPPHLPRGSDKSYLTTAPSERIVLPLASQFLCLRSFPTKKGGGKEISFWEVIPAGEWTCNVELSSTMVD